MRHLKAEFDKLTFKELLTYAIALLCMVAAVVAIFLGLYLPPRGEVHASVLTYFGISAAFVGSLLGITMHFNNELARFKSETLASLGTVPDSNAQPAAADNSQP